MVEKYPDITLSEYCEYWLMNYKEAISPNMMYRELKKQDLTRKKIIRGSQSATKRVQNYMCEYWEKVKNIDHNNLVFLDKIGVLLDLTRTHARSRCGSRVYDLKQFYRGAKTTVVRAISFKKVVGIMTLDGSMYGKAFSVFIEHFIGSNLWKGAVVVLDNLLAHKLVAIEPLIESAGATILNLSSYFPNFNPIELWWLQLKAFLRQFSPTTTNMVDVLLTTALDLVNTKHFTNWFTSCCYCTL